MTSKNSTARKSKTQPKPTLSTEEVRRIAEKLAIALEHRAENIGMLTLLFDHLENVSSNHIDLWSCVFEIKTGLFTGTDAATEAQEQFQAQAYANRGKLLQWPYEQRESAS